MNVRIIEQTYRKDEEGSLPVRIYLPEKPGPLPALLDVHGGAWSKGQRGDNERVDLALAENGVAVFAIELRKAPRYAYPAQVADINYATRWLKVHAGEYGVDPGRLGGFAASSGGHGLFLSAMRPDDEGYTVLPLQEESGQDARLDYLVAAWPVLDPFARYLFARESSQDFLVNATESYFPDQITMSDGNPVLALERGERLVLPPALIIQGTADTNVPLASVYRFADAYRKAGGQIDVEWFADMPHGFACRPGAESDRALEIVKNFVTCHAAKTNAAP